MKTTVRTITGSSFLEDLFKRKLLNFSYSKKNCYVDFLHLDSLDTCFPIPHKHVSSSNFFYIFLIFIFYVFILYLHLLGTDNDLHAFQRLLQYILNHLKSYELNLKS